MNGHISRVPRLILIAAATLAINVSDVRAQEDSDFVKRCASWIYRKGYSRDYVEHGGEKT